MKRRKPKAERKEADIRIRVTPELSRVLARVAREEHVAVSTLARALLWDGLSYRALKKTQPVTLPMPQLDAAEI